VSTLFSIVGASLYARWQISGAAIDIARRHPPLHPDERGIAVCPLGTTIARRSWLEFGTISAAMR
jgi:hypothetical protein